MSDRVAGVRDSLSVRARSRIVLLALLALVGQAAAQRCTYEVEPNDQPPAATPLAVGGVGTPGLPAGTRLPVVCLAGDVTGGQDLFVWRVDEAAAGHSWRLEVEGTPGQLTAAEVYQFTFTPDGQGVTDSDGLLRVESRGDAASSDTFLVAPGTYYLGVAGSREAADYVVRLVPTSIDYRSRQVGSGTRVAGEFTAFAPSGDEIAFTLTVDADASTFTWDLSFAAPLGSAAGFSVEGPGGRVVDEVFSGAGTVSVRNVGLAEGEHTITFTPRGVERQGGSYLLTVARGARVSNGVEVEPNDAYGLATAFPLGTGIEGSLEGHDYFRVEVDEPGVWDLTVAADAELRVQLLDDQRRPLQDRRGVGGTLTGLDLDVGSYYVWLSGGRDVDYRLEWSSGASATPGTEVEPNDAPFTATPLGPDAQARGVLGPQDVDTFELSVVGEAQLYRLQVVGEGVTEITLVDKGGNRVATARGERRIRLDEVTLLPGPHYLTVRGSGEYALRALSLGPAPVHEPAADAPAADVELAAAPATPEATEGEPEDALAPLPPPPPGVRELEPNDDVTRANRLESGVAYVGRLASREDIDFYRFHLANDQYVRVELVQADGDPTLPLYVDNVRQVPNSVEDHGPAVALLWLLAGDHQIDIRGSRVAEHVPTGYYRLRFNQLGPLYRPGVAEMGGEANGPTTAGAEAPDAAQGETLAVAAHLTLGFDEAAAYWHEGQRVDGVLALENSSGSSLSLALTGASSDARVTVSTSVPRVELRAGESAELPVQVELPSDLRGGAPLLVQVEAQSVDGAVVAEREIAVRCEALPRSPFDYWPLPSSLLGRPNVLLPELGASYQGDMNARAARLNDRRIAVSQGFYLAPEVPAVIALPGAQPLTIVGTVLHPLSGGDVARQLAGFRVESSLDGTNWSTAVEGSLASARYEQAFVFDEPVDARFVRLVFVSNVGAVRNYGGTLGEWSVIGADTSLLSGLNLADPAFGGHVVWASPRLAGADSVSLLTQEHDARQVDFRSFPQGLTAVIGFQDGRAGLISGMEWWEAEAAAGADALFESLTVEASLAGPAGPWTELGEWSIVRDGRGRFAFQLDEPAWARYLRLRSPVPEGARYLYSPERVVVTEVAADGDYASLLGEWGLMSQAGPYERHTGVNVAVAGEEAVDNDTLASASQLVPGQAVSGTVAVAEDVDYYRVRVPDGSNHLLVRLEGDPAIAFRYELTDSQGVPINVVASEEGNAWLVEAFVEPGDYYLKLEEPKRTVIFAWDTSGSVAPYLPITYSSLAAFAQGVDGDREAVQLLAFDDPSPKWLLPYWSSDALRVQTAISEFDRQADSSNSFVALWTATTALADREGTRAVLFMTDAETGDGGDMKSELWRALQEVRPQVFTFEISSGGNARAQDLMQDWAAVNGGVYDMAAGVGDFDAGFERASCLLRRPKRYIVEVEVASEEPPGPGTLTVTQPEGATNGAVHVIFDASGSMGSLLPSGESRIDAARRALSALVGEVLEEGTPFSLRAFGHVAPSSCETRLEVPLAPLDRGSAARVVAAISPKLLSQTALADSLSLVSDDVARANGPVTVILITDGEESCGGDPGAAAAALTASGEVAIAIVSLALEPPAFAVFEGLASEVGATYVDVGSFEALQAAIAEALYPEFEVYDAAGNVVARGRMGEGVELPMGLYSVQVLGAAPTLIREVAVPGDGAVRVEVPGG